MLVLASVVLLITHDEVATVRDTVLITLNSLLSQADDRQSYVVLDQVRAPRDFQ